MRRSTARGTDECVVRKGCARGNSAAVACAGDASCPEHGRAGDAVAGGPGKGVAIDKAAQVITASGARSGRGEGAAAAHTEAMAVG